MPRREQIEKAAKTHFDEKVNGDAMFGFIRGAEWAYANPFSYESFRKETDDIIMKLQAQLKMKQDDWIKACQEIDELQDNLAIAVEALKGYSHCDDEDSAPINQAARKALAKIEGGK